MNERLHSLKGVVLTDLSVTAIACFVGEEESESGQAIPIFEMEVINQPDWEKFDAPKAEARRCAICGHSLKIACAVTHHTSGHGYWIGRDCSNTVESLKKFNYDIKGATLAMAQRLACDKREADFLAEHPDSISIIAWCKRPSAPKIARNMLENLRRYGNMSEKQIALLEKIRTQDAERRASATSKVVPGRQSIKGKVVKVTVTHDDFSNTDKAKIIVDCGTGVRLMGNCPEYSTITDITVSRCPAHLELGNQADTKDIIKAGDMVEFTATVEASPRDELFGFWKRPAKFIIAALAPTQTVLSTKT